MSAAPYSALRSLLNLYDLAPANATHDVDRIVVNVNSVAALHVFADAVQKAVVSEDGERFIVAHEVDGVPALFVAESRQTVDQHACRLQIVRNGFGNWFWRFIASNGEQLARSSETYVGRPACDRSIVVTFGLESDEQAQPGATWYGHGHETVVVEEVAA